MPEPTLMPAADPVALLYAAAQHVRDGVPEVELEWWEDTEGGERRLTVTTRGMSRNAALSGGVERLQVRNPKGEFVRGHQVPNTPEGLEDPPCPG